MAANISLSQTNPISNPDSPEFRAACENLSLVALGILAWAHYATTYFPNQTFTMDELDPNLEPGVEKAVYELFNAGFVYFEGEL